jgi:hypothetical protein
LPPWRGLDSIGHLAAEFGIPADRPLTPSASEIREVPPLIFRERDPSLRSMDVDAVHLLRSDPHPARTHFRRSTMYDLYPEWGPAKNNPDSSRSSQAVQAALDLRDNGGQRPDDN